jgi:hypothetical protein
MSNFFLPYQSGSDGRTIPNNNIAVQADMPFTGLTKFGGAFLSKFECFICNLVMCWIGKIGPYCNLVMCWISNVLGAGAYLQLLITLLAIPLSLSFPNNLHLELFLYIKAVWLAR